MQADNEALIRIEGLRKSFRTDTVETTALDDVSISVGSGEFVAVTGPSGCGKSTLLNILGLLDSPDGGSYRLLGEEVAESNEAVLSDIRRQHIAFVFQSFNLLDELTVQENIEFALMYHDVSAAERRERSRAVMERLGIAHRSGHRPNQLSGGQQQRVAIARALITEPTLILADEPTGNLDSKNGRDVMDMLKTLNEEGATIVMVTHSAADAGFAGRTINLSDGRVTGAGEVH